MSAWTAIIIPAFIIAKCSLDFIGLEFSPKHQCSTDQQFFAIAIVFIAFGLIVDITNFWSKILRHF